MKYKWYPSIKGDKVFISFTYTQSITETGIGSLELPADDYRSIVTHLDQMKNALNKRYEEEQPQTRTG